jgi:hypothetical protein
MTIDYEKQDSEKRIIAFSIPVIVLIMVLSIITKLNPVEIVGIMVCAGFFGGFVVFVIGYTGSLIYDIGKSMQIQDDRTQMQKIRDALSWQAVRRDLLIIISHIKIAVNQLLDAVPRDKS